MRFRGIISTVCLGRGTVLLQLRGSKRKSTFPTAFILSSRLSKVQYDCPHIDRFRRSLKAMFEMASMTSRYQLGKMQ